MYRIRIKGHKKYIDQLPFMDYYNIKEHRLIDFFADTSKEGRIFNNFEVNNYKKLIKEYKDFINSCKIDFEHPLVIFRPLELVECVPIECTIKESTHFMIKNLDNGKYSIGKGKFSDIGKIYDKKHYAETALSRLSKSTKNKRKTKAGKVLFMNKNYINCEIVPCKITDGKIVKL